MKIPSVFARSRLPIFLRLIGNGVAQASCAVCSVLLIRWIFDSLIIASGPVEFSHIVLVGLGLLLCALGLGWLQAMERVDAERLGQGYVHQIRMRLYRHLSAVGPRVLQERSRGALNLRFIGDLNAVKRWVSMGLVQASVSGMVILVSLIAMAVLNWRLGLTLLLVVLVGVIYASFLGGAIREASRESRKRRTYLATNVTEKVTSLPVVQVFGQERRERRRLRKQSERLTEAMVERAKRIGAMRGMTQALTTLASGLVLLEGAREVSNGLTTPGVVVAAMSVVGLLLPPLRGLGRVYEYYQDSRISVERIKNFMQMPAKFARKDDYLPFVPGPGLLELREVCFDPLFRDISVVVPPGSRITVVGANGSGKSTLLSLIAKMVDPDSGAILLDGQDLADLDPKSVRETVSVVAPDLPLLRGTLRRNLLYRHPRASEEEIERVWKLCGIDQMLAELPQHDQTRVTEEGGNLSLGQRQMVTLARALLGEPKILLLDEAENFLDWEATQTFSDILRKFPGTILRVSHDYETIAPDDDIWLIEDGGLTILSGEEFLTLQENRISEG
ncbi:MAG: ABC transporter ATP-binding protein [Desulfobulbus sp.]|jgi:ABC-type multidrug transport system fused ATPase/permease subunit